MFRIPSFTLAFVAPFAALALLLASTTAPAFAHARYDRSEPMAGAMVDASPGVLRAWFTQELMLRSAIVVTDEAGNQVDLGDGRVDPDDPDRKSMLVSLPPLPAGAYWVYWSTVSAEDGDSESGSFTFGVGVMPPTARVDNSPTVASGGRPSHTCGEL
jgi:methionine-rich copper-binding protein CopC